MRGQSLRLSLIYGEALIYFIAGIFNEVVAMSKVNVFQFVIGNIRIFRVKADYNKN